MKKVLVVEPVSSGWMLIPKGRELGYYVTVMSYQQNASSIPEQYLKSANRLVTVDTNERLKALSVARELYAGDGLDAVLPGHEYYVPLVADISSQLGLPGLKPEFVDRVRLKDRMRSALHDAGVRGPLFMLAATESELEKAVAYVGYPCVVKPIDCGGSLNVRKVINQIELLDAFATIMNTPRVELEIALQRQVLVEEYLDGPEYSVEGYVEGGKPTFLSITEKFLGPEPYFVEVGHIVSAQLPVLVEQSVYSYMELVLRALKLDVGPFHCEFRLTRDGPVLIETAARLAGDRICDLISYATGIDYYKAIYNCFLRIPNLQEGKIPHRFAGIRFFICPGLNSYSSVKGVEKIQKIPGFMELTFVKKPEEFIPFPSSYLGRIGYAIFTSDSYNQLRSTLESLPSLLEFVGL